MTHTVTGKSANLECKSEYKETGNLFIESWSNRTAGRPGWLFNLTECDILLYHFLEPDGALYTVKFSRLREFDFSRYREVPQSRYLQANDTWGYLVPVNDLREGRVITQKESVPLGMAQFRASALALHRAAVAAQQDPATGRDSDGGNIGPSEMRKSEECQNT